MAGICRPCIFFCHTGRTPNHAGRQTSLPQFGYTFGPKRLPEGVSKPFAPLSGPFGPCDTPATLFPNLAGKRNKRLREGHHGDVMALLNWQSKLPSVK